jgi:hypothetical protein
MGRSAGRGQWGGDGEQEEEEGVLAYIKKKRNKRAPREGEKNGRLSPVQVNEIERAVDKIEARGGGGKGGGGGGDLVKEMMGKKKRRFFVRS